MTRRKLKLPQEPVEITIEHISHDGRGVARLNGKTIFIHGALPQETVKFKYTRRHRRFDEGEIIEILKPHPDRATPRCPHYHLCGGCQFQHANSNFQLQYKQNVLLEQLKHFGQIAPQEWLSPVMGPAWNYRRKARLSVRHVPGKSYVLIGFHERNGRYITDMSQCPILHQSISEKILLLRQWIADLENFENIPQIELAAGDEQTALVIRHLKPFSESDLNKIIQFATTHQFEIYLQPSDLMSVHQIWPTNTLERLSYHLPNDHLELFFHPCDFTQINQEINAKMISLAIELLQPKSTDRILDLFCGIGNFTLPFAKHCQQILGIDGNSHAIERAKENVTHNKLTNIHFMCADLNNPIILDQPLNKIILDPPRTGASEILKTFSQIQPIDKILYISCHPATLARDAGQLVALGFALQKVGILDMFPQTKHFESIALFNKIR